MMDIDTEESDEHSPIYRAHRR